MPKQRVGDIDIYYEVHGHWPQTLVMVRGLGSNLCAWYEQTPVLARHFRTVVFDNRGAGRTDKPDTPYSMRQMAADTVGLMDALAIDRAAVLGISMGGMIAQEVALNHPQRLSALILGCTNFGGPGVVQADPEIISAVMAGTNATPAQKRLQLRASFSNDTIGSRPEFLARDEEVRASNASPSICSRTRQDRRKQDERSFETDVMGISSSTSARYRRSLSSAAISSTRMCFQGIPRVSAQSRSTETGNREVGRDLARLASSSSPRRIGGETGVGDGVSRT